MNKRLIGNDYEQIAADFLIENGLHIMEKNYRIRSGEIDIIARDNRFIVFVEVKYRKTASKGHPEEAVNYYKIKKICKVADYYRIYKKFPDNQPFRFDVIAIEGNEIKWYKNAFPYCG